MRVSGTKRELVARVFSAMENFIEPVLTATEAVEELKDEYQKKVLINNVKCSDPFNLLDGYLKRTVLKNGQWFCIQIFLTI